MASPELESDAISLPAARPRGIGADTQLEVSKLLTSSLDRECGGRPREPAGLGVRLTRQAVLDGVPDQLDPVVQLQLAERVLHVVLHGAVRQYQPGGNLLVGQAGG